MRSPEVKKFIDDHQYLFLELKQIYFFVKKKDNTFAAQMERFFTLRHYCVNQTNVTDRREAFV